MSRRAVIVGAFLVSAAAASLASAAPKQPNVLFIFADDQCFDTINALGNNEIHTPNLDRLARESVVFRRAYNMGSFSGAVCIASRMMLNSGRFVWDAGRLYKDGEQERQAGRWWSEYMKGAGYETYMTGKWHLKADAEKSFDHVVHVRPGMPKQTEAGYNRPIEGQPMVWHPWDKKYGGFWEGGKHWSEVLADDAEEFLGHAATVEKPFFMYLAFNASHDPRQSPRRFVEMYPWEEIALPKSFVPEYPYMDAIGCGKGLRDERLAPFPRTEYAVKVHRQEYYAIITHMDQQIGRILKALEKTGKADNTWIFYTADHGLAVGHHGLMGKQNMYDDSVRVPLLVHGPGLDKGKDVEARVYLQDIMPTVLELAGVEKPEHVRFQSLMPLLHGEDITPYEATYGAYLDKQRAVTCRGYKLILYPAVPVARLYNLEKDPLETCDLADRPESKPIMKRLFNQLRKLQQETDDSLDLTETFADLMP